MITKILGGVVLALSIALFFAGKLYINASNEVAAGKVVIQALNDVIAANKKAIKDAEDLLIERDMQRKSARKRANDWESKWKEAQRNDAECKNWSDSPLPDCAIERLHEPTESTDKGNGGASGRTYISNAGVWWDYYNEWGTTGKGTLQPRTIAAVQRGQGIYKEVRGQAEGSRLNIFQAHLGEPLTFALSNQLGRFELHSPL